MERTAILIGLRLGAFGLTDLHVQERVQRSYDLLAGVHIPHLSPAHPSVWVGFSWSLIFW